MLWSSSRIGLKYYLRAHNGNGLNCYGTGSSHVSGARGTAQIQRAYNLRTLYSRGITGKGATIVVIDPYGSPTIGRDLRTFDRTEGVPNPPSLRIIRPAGKVPAFNPNNANMVGWASGTTRLRRPGRIQPGGRTGHSEWPVFRPGAGSSGRPLK